MTLPYTTASGRFSGYNFKGRISNKIILRSFIANTFTTQINSYVLVNTSHYNAVGQSWLKGRKFERDSVGTGDK